MLFRSPQEDKKLTGDMRAMYDRLQPTGENTQRRDRFVKKLQTILETEFPGNEFKVHVFGSSGNMLYTSESDGKTDPPAPPHLLTGCALTDDDSRHLHTDTHDQTGGDAWACRGSGKAYVCHLS